MSCSGITSLRTLREEQKMIEAQLTKKLEEQKAIEVHLRKTLEEQKEIETELRKNIEDKQTELDAKTRSEEELLKQLISLRSNELIAVHKEYETEDQLLEMESKLTELKTELSQSSKKNNEIESKLKYEYTVREKELHSQLMQLKESMAWYQNYFTVQQVKEKEMLLLQAQYDDVLKHSNSLRSKHEALELEFNLKIESMNAELNSKNEVISQLNNLVNELSAAHKEDIQRLKTALSINSQSNPVEDTVKDNAAVTSKPSDDVSQYQNKLQSLEQTLAALKIQHETQHLELVVNDQKRTEAEKALVILQQEIDTSKKSLNQSSIKCSEFEQSLLYMNTVLEQERQQFSSYMNTLQSQVYTLQVANEEIKVEMLKQSLQTETEHEKTNSKILELTKVEAQLKKEAGLVKQQHEDSVIELKKMQESNELLQSRIESVSSELACKDDRIIGLTEQLKEESALHKVSHQRLQIEIERVLQETASLQQQLASLEQKSKDDAATIDIQYMSVCREQEALQSLENDYSALKAQWGSLTTTLASRDEIILQLNTQLTDTAAATATQLAVLEQQVKDDATAIQQQATTISQEKEKLQAAEQALTSIKSQHDDLKSEMNRKKEERVELDKSLTSQKEELESCQVYLKQWNEFWPEYEHNLMYANAMLEQERQQHNATNSQLQSSVNKLSKVEEQFNATHTQLQQSSEQNKSLESRLQSLNDQLIASQQKSKDDATVISEQKEKYQSLEQVVVTLKLQLDTTQTQLSAQDDLVLRISAQLADETAQQKEINQQLKIDFERENVISTTLKDQLAILEQKSKDDATIIEQQFITISQEQEKLQSIEQNMTALRSYQDDAASELARKNEKLVELEKSNVNQKEELESAKTVLKQWNDAWPVYEQNLMYVNSVLEQERQQYSVYVDGLQTQITELKTTNSQLQSSVIKLSKVEEEFNATHTQLQQSSEQNKSLQSKLQSLNDHLIASQQKSKEDTTVISEQKEKLQSLEQVIITLQSQRDSLTSEMKVNDDKRAELEKSLTNQKEELESCKKSLKQWNDAWPVYEQNLMYANSVLEQERQHSVFKGEYDVQIAKLQTQLNESKASNEILEADLQKQSQEAELEFDRMNAKIFEITRLEVTYQQDAEFQRQQNDVLTTKYNKLQEQFKPMQAKVEYMSSELIAKEEAIQQLNNKMQEESVKLQTQIENDLLVGSKLKQQLALVEQKSKDDAVIINQQSIIITQQDEKLQSTEQALAEMKIQYDTSQSVVIKKDEQLKKLENAFITQKEELESCKKSLKQWNDAWPVYEQNLMYVNSVLEQERLQHSVYKGEYDAQIAKLQTQLNELQTSNECLKIEMKNQAREAEQFKLDSESLEQSLQHELSQLITSQDRHKKGMNEIKLRFASPKLDT